VQLGCNGIVHILFEPINPAAVNNPIALLEKAVMQKTVSVIVTLFSLDNPQREQTGTCLLVTEQSQTGTLSNAALQYPIQKDIETVFAKNASLIKKYVADEKESCTALIELLKPPVEIVIAGAGNDVLPLIEIAAISGWHVTIADGRKTHANAQRFAKAKKIIVGKPAEVLQQLNIPAPSIFVLMSHNYNYDIGMLRLLIKQPCRYIGVLGPKKKLEKMLDELQAAGMDITEKDKEKVFGPMGLDIGAETAEEIALSIVAEIKAVIEKREGSSLRNKKGFIHAHGHTAISVPDGNQPTSSTNADFQ
jgi:xanthine dehydrogenase accessory factor